MKGTFIVVVGPSGSGKGTLVSHIRPLFPQVVYAKSTTTRSMRAGETEETAPYYFLSIDEFKSRIERGDFLEWAEYGGNLYGTLRSEVEQNLTEERVVLKEMEVQGARQILDMLPREQLRIIFIDAGSWEEMEARIAARAPMTEAELAKRRERYEDEMSFMEVADVIIQNPMGEVEQAKRDFEDAIRTIVEKR